MEQGADVLARQVSPAFGLTHQQGELFEGQGGGIRMHRRDRAGVTGVDVAQVEEGRPVTKLLQQDAVRPHAQGAFKQLLGPDPGQTLSVLGIDQMDDIAVRHHELAGILDRQQTLMVRNQSDQPLGQGGLARPGRAGDQDVASGRDREGQKARPVAGLAQPHQLGVDEVGGLRLGVGDLVEQSGLRELLQTKASSRRLSQGQGDASVRRHRRQNDLTADVAGQGGRADRLFGADVLTGIGRGRHGQGAKPGLGQLRGVGPEPGPIGLDPDFAGPVDDDLGDGRRLQEGAERREVVIEDRGVVHQRGRS